MDILKSARKYLFTALAALLAAGFTACDESMFDSEGDCEVTHSIRFLYEKNLKWADAFPSEVRSVHLYAFDTRGLFVKEYTAAGEALSEPGWLLPLDLPTGTYRFVAWCGLENGAAEESFTVPQPVAGVTTIEELTCTLNTTRGDDGETSGDELDFLYYGRSEETLVDNHDGQDYVYDIYLTQDTNHIRIILNELTSDEDMDPKDYDIRIEAVNGLMGHDNELLGNTVVTYTPWDISADEVAVGKPDADDEVKTIRGIIADFSVSRMTAGQAGSMRLTITDRRSNDKIITRVPVIHYALLSKGYYEKAYRHQMTDQDFLDREDEYVFTFFLYDNKWLDSYIDIHSWRVVLHDYEVGTEH